MEDFVSYISNETLEEFRKKKQPKIILFTEK